MPADATARSLTDRVDALAAALSAAGVPAEQSAALLASAAAAAMHAVTLDALRDGAPDTFAPGTQAADRLRLAA
jgi:hypothetical protein